MKILHVIDSGGLYGAEMMLLNLMSEQVALGGDPVLASIGEQGVGEKPVEREARLRGLAVQQFRMKAGPNLLGLGRMLYFARREGVHLIHSHGYKGNVLFGLLPRSIRRLPMVATVHGWTCTGGMTRMTAYQWLDALSWSRMDRVIVVNQAMKEHPSLRKRRGVALEVVPNGIPPQRPTEPWDSRGPAAEIERFCRRGCAIGAVGRLSPEKGFDLLLEALALLAEEGRDVRLVILGEGGARGALEEQARGAGLEQRVLLPGYLPNAGEFLRFFDLLAMPSLTEGLPIVLLEAMQAGVPVVATRVGGIPDVLQDGRCGLLVGPGSPQALAAGIKAVLDAPEDAAQRVREGRQRVLQEYSSVAMAEKYQEIYREVLQ